MFSILTLEARHDFERIFLVQPMILNELPMILNESPMILDGFERAVYDSARI